MRWWIASFVLAAACGSKGDDAKARPAPPSAPAPSPPPAPPVPPPPPPAVDPGKCNLSFSGKESVVEEVPRNNASVMTEYWLGAAEREQLKAQTGAAGAMVDALKLLTLNCEGKDASVSIVPGKDATAQSIPFGPKTYRLDKGTGDLAVLAKVKGQLVVNPSGTITITAFDARHIAATLDLAGTTMDRSPVTFSGSLDYACMGLSGCP